MAQELPEELRQNPSINTAPEASNTAPKSDIVADNDTIIEEQILPDGTKKRIIKRIIRRNADGTVVNNAPINRSTINVKRILYGFLGLLVVSILVFYGLLFWGLLDKQFNNPLFKALGMDSLGLQTTLLTMTNVIFGILTIVFLIFTLIRIFQYITTNNDNPRLKRSKMIDSIIDGVLFLLCGALWVGLYIVISSAQVEARAKTEETYITTNPKVVVGLSAPLTVEYDIVKVYNQLGKERILEVLWDFEGDGITDAKGQKVSHRYTDLGENGGRYPVNVVVKYKTDPANPKSEEKEFRTNRETIIDNVAITADIVASPESGIPPLSVEFSALKSYDPDGEIINYEWDLNDDGVYDEQGIDKTIVSKKYEKMGIYTVSLRVTGRNGDSNIIKKSVEVKAPDDNLRAEISAIGELEGFSPLKIVFDGTPSIAKIGKIVKYEWFIDGEEDSFVGRKYEKTFREVGDYTVKLVIESDDGGKTEATKTVKVLPDNQEVKLKIDTTPNTNNKEGILMGAAPFTITFDSSKSEIKDAIEWAWDFENDGIDDMFKPAVQNTFYTPGNYETKLTITDSKGTKHTLTKQIRVDKAGLQAIIDANPSNGEVPLTVLFDASGSLSDEDDEIINYLWTMPGQEPINYGAQISYEFKNVGTFPVKVQVQSERGKMSEMITNITVRQKALKAEFAAEPNEGLAPLNVQFTARGTEGIVASYLWDFGDNTPLSTDIRPMHTYTKAGTYNAKLRVTDRKGIISEALETVIVRQKKAESL